MKFSEIISDENMSFEEMTAERDKLKVMSRSEKAKLSSEELAGRETKENPILSVERQKKNIASIAKMLVNGHAGYEQFDEGSKRTFEKEIERLYNGADKEVDTKSFVASLGNVFLKMPDNHLQIRDSNGNSLFHEAVEPSVGKNVEDKAKYSFTTKEVNGQKVGVVALPDLGSVAAPQWAQFAKDFEKARFDENGNENWDSIIIDARGMPGGNSAPMEFLARSLYGNEVRSCDKETHRDTKEADYLRYINKDITEKEYKDRMANHKYTGKNVVSLDSSNHPKDFPAFVNGGYNRPINMLIDRGLASAGESLYSMMKDHPGVTFIGERTNGCCTEGSAKEYVADCGYGIKLATRHNLYKEGVVEKKGFAPDIDVSGKNAFNYTIANLDKINSKSIAKINNYKIPDGYNKLKDLPITQNDMTYIRGVRDGYPIDVVKGLYDPLNKEDGKAQKWEKLLDFAKNGKQVEAQTKLKKLSNTSVKPPKLKSKACGVGSKGQKLASIKARIENISNPTKSEGKGQKNIDSNVASIASNAKKTR